LVSIAEQTRHKPARTERQEKLGAGNSKRREEHGAVRVQILRSAPCKDIVPPRLRLLSPRNFRVHASIDSNDGVGVAAELRMMRL
jgi:hypothetical protein